MPESFSIPYVPTLFLWMHNNTNSMCNCMMPVKYRAGWSNMTFRNIKAAAEIFFFLFFLFYTSWCGNGSTQTHHELTLIYAESLPIDLERKHVMCNTVCVYIHTVYQRKHQIRARFFFLSDFIIFSSSDTLILEWHSRVWFPPLLNPSV